MFNPNKTVIDAFATHTLAEYRRLFPAAAPQQVHALERATYTALETLLNCDCSYHDLHHTILVTEVGQTILHGRQIAKGDLDANDWLQAVVGMLFHDVGYLRVLLSGDSSQTSVINEQGDGFIPPAESTDACMTPYHVTRGAMYVSERFANDPTIDIKQVNACIEMTRFPVPNKPQYHVTDSLPGLVRAADLIGQMADPQYMEKLSRLFAEFTETGEANRLGFDNPKQLRAGFPAFFYNNVHPYIDAGVEYLKRTQAGHQWIANLYHHLYLNKTNQDFDPRIRAPELVIDNVAVRSR